MKSAEFIFTQFPPEKMKKRISGGVSRQSGGSCRWGWRCEPGWVTWTAPRLHRLHPALFPAPLSRYVLKGRADCWRRTVWAAATHTHTLSHTHTPLQVHRYSHSKLSVLLRCLHRQGSGLGSFRGLALRPPGVYALFSENMEERKTTSTDFSLLCSTATLQMVMLWAGIGHFVVLLWQW